MELNNIYNEDCLDTMRRMPVSFVDLVVTSPPYDSLRLYGGYVFDLENTVKSLFRVIKNGGVIVWIVNDQTKLGSETGTSFRQALEFMECGFNLHDTMIWEKDTFSLPSSNRYRSIFEYMFVFSKGKPKTVNLIADKQNKYAGMNIHGTSRGADGQVIRKSNHNKSKVSEFGVRNNIWKISTEKHNTYGHPAVFPEQLVHDHIISWSCEEDIVYDPFMGSGTTAVVASSLKRRYIGSEIAREYCEIAEKRRANFGYVKFSLT